MKVVIRKKSAQQIRKEAKLKKTKEQLKSKDMSAAKRKRKTAKLEKTEKQVKTARVKSTKKADNKAARTKRKVDRKTTAKAKKVAKKAVKGMKKIAQAEKIEGAHGYGANKKSARKRTAGERKRTKAKEGYKNMTAAEKNQVEIEGKKMQQKNKK